MVLADYASTMMMQMSEFYLTAYCSALHILAQQSIRKKNYENPKKY